MEKFIKIILVLFMMTSSQYIYGDSEIPVEPDDETTSDGNGNTSPKRSKRIIPSVKYRSGGFIFVQAGYDPSEVTLSITDENDIEIDYDVQIPSHNILIFKIKNYIAGSDYTLFLYCNGTYWKGHFTAD